MVYGVGEPHMLYRIFGMIKKRLIPLPDIPAMDSVLQLVAVENVVDALILAMEKDEALEGTFLIADKEIFTLKSLVTMLYDYLGAGKPRAIRGWLSNILLSMPLLRRVKLRFKNRIYDISRARRLLGYDPAVKTAEGLKCAADEWLRRNSVSK
jgi:nucleoside-diphosphate-sugar epimerase